MSRLFNLNAFYDWLAPAYATGQALLPMWRRYTEAVLPSLPPEGKVLEVGPGPGVLLAKISERVPFAAGLDLSAGMLRQARRRLLAAGRPVQLSRGDVTRIPFASGAFDAVTLTFALSAVPDGMAAVREMARVLRPGGRLVLVDACYPSDANRAGTALARLWELGGDWLRDEAAMMEAAGLTVLFTREFGAFNSIRLVVGRKN